MNAPIRRLYVLFLVLFGVLIYFTSKNAVFDAAAPVCANPAFPVICGYRLSLKKRFISCAHSSASTPQVSWVLG